MLRVLFASLCALSACDKQPKGGDSGQETDEPCPETSESELAISSVSVACDEQDNVRLQLDASFTPSRGLAFIQATSRPDTESDQAAENHELSPISSDDCGPTGSLERLLQTGAEEVSAESTTFTCTEILGGELTIAFAVLDASDVVVACIVIGDDPLGLVNSVYHRQSEPGFDTSSCVEGDATPQ